MKRLRVRMKAEDKKDSKLFGAMFSKVGKMYQDVPAPKPAEPLLDPREPTYEGEAATPMATDSASDSDGEGPSTSGRPLDEDMRTATA
jgi:hypothetical protein